MATKVAVVTGSNKGIGFAIVRGLCKRFDGDVYLTSRDLNRGQNAVAELNKEGLHPKYHQLDITDRKSIEKFRDYLKENYGGIDILVNNAAIAFKVNAPEPVAVQAEQTLFVNYYSVLSTCEILFPILRNGARVVNISSSCGHLSKIKSEKLRNQLKDPNLTIEGLSNLMQEYINAAKQGTHAGDWGNSCYVVSKVALTALTMIQQRMLADRDIKVNAVHPGYVDTDMTSHKGVLTIDEGAVAPLYIALDAPDSVKGQYVWKDKRIISWEGKLVDKD
ncbi:carbonyl reductase [NADPH] 1-like [Pieris napi]|uniref:carbonyl reductase [NADPH] 1-like n=1 Tax=Pieris napi TaxID=78633 RepID=UPI001FB8A3F1|nr:carbonyl reductase [NADPH] 1-like [Pieris napi]XP_047516832.1 carbonyl reductase [NADPH] 1-like [Pieris napi]XP_047516833.1 carbonyl reductase [NADPH] 1-like [Pieris napi]